MNQHVFQDTLDNLPSPPRLSVRTLLFVCVCTIGVFAWSVFYLATEGFTRGTLEEVTSFEKQTLDEMHDSGIVLPFHHVFCWLNPVYFACARPKSEI